MQQEKETIERILAGDLNAFKVLIGEHQGLVTSMVRRMVKNPDAVKDVCQDVFIKVFKNLKGFRYQSKLSTWIAQIAYTTAVDQVKKASGNRQVAVGPEALADLYQTSDNPESILLKKNTAAFLQQEIARLPLQYCTILTLYHLRELPYSEIAVIMDLPEGTVKSYLFRARKLLKDNLTKHLKEF